MNIVTADRMTDNTIKIDQRFTPATVRYASRFSHTLGTDVVDIKVGVIDHARPWHVDTLVLTVPMRRLLNGRKVDSIRTIRFNHLLNIITSWAAEVHQVCLTSSSVVFLGFQRS